MYIWTSKVWLYIASRVTSIPRSKISIIALFEFSNPFLIPTLSIACLRWSWAVPTRLYHTIDTSISIGCLCRVWIITLFYSWHQNSITTNSSAYWRFAHTSKSKFYVTKIRASITWCCIGIITLLKAWENVSISTNDWTSIRAWCCSSCALPIWLSHTSNTSFVCGWGIKSLSSISIITIFRGH